MTELCQKLQGLADWRKYGPYLALALSFHAGIHARVPICSALLGKKLSNLDFTLNLWIFKCWQ